MDKRLRVQPVDIGPKFLTKEAMESLSTPRLLAYRKQLRRYGSRIMEARTISLETSNTQIWDETMADAKAILDTREHVEKR